MLNLIHIIYIVILVFAMESSQLSKIDMLYRAIDSEDAGAVENVLTSQHISTTDILNERLTPHCKMTALHLAVGLNLPDVCKILLKFGSDPNSLNCQEKSSPLHLGIMYDYEDIVKILVNAGGDPLKLDGEHKTCYDLVHNDPDLKHLLKILEITEKVEVSKRDETETIETDPVPSSNPSRVIVEDVRRLTSSIEDSLIKDRHNEFMEESLLTCRNNSSPTMQKYYVLRNTHPKFYFTECDPEGCEGSELNGVQESGFAAYLMTEDESTALSGTTTSVSSYSPSTSPTPSSASVSCSTYSCSTCNEVIHPSEKVEPANHELFKSPSKKDVDNLQAMMKDMNLKLPVTSSTVPVLANLLENKENALVKLQKDIMTKDSCSFTTELQLALTNFELLHSWGNHKIELLQSINNTPSQRTSKSFYNYVLLDPKIIKRSNFSGNYLKSDIIKSTEKFQQFLNSIFYIGKGCGNRPIQHLVEAKAKLQNIKKLKESEKIDRILDIWKRGQGIIIHSIFHHSAEREANVNEAAMLDAIGIRSQLDLTNIKKGSYVGTRASQWPQKTKNQFGSFLLYKCFCSFVVSDYKTFFPHDF